MTTDLIEFYKNIDYKNKDISEYKDNEGTRFYCNTASLIVSKSYVELNKEKYEQEVFNGSIPKDFKTTEIEIDKPTPKYDITHKDSDKYIITTIKQKVKQVWFVKNNLGLIKAFNNNSEADKVYEEINNKILEKMI